MIDEVDLKSLSLEDSLDLELPFSELEIKEAVWSYVGDKSPGPDGFSFCFFQSCWEVIKADVIRFMKDFHSSKAATASFLALIPKSDSPQELNSYRPICLVSCFQKIISKILAGRLKFIIGSISSIEQTAFVHKRSIFDGVLVVNKVMDVEKMFKKNCLLMKINFERANDYVNLGFLRYLLKHLNFSIRWRSWMEVVAFHGSSLVLVNGSVTQEFSLFKRLRQGDALSPFLFMYVMEGHNGIMKKTVHEGLFRGFKVIKDISFNILQYEDDTILLGEGCWSNI